MIDPGLSRRYARALFAVAQEHGVAESVDGEFTSFCRLLDENPRMHDLMRNPRVPAAEKSRFLRSVLEGLADRVLQEFLLFLFRKHRFELVHEVGDAYHLLAEEARNVATAKVTSAVPLAPGERARLQSVLQSRTGKTVNLQEAVDAAVIGGLSVIIEGKIIDDTVRHHLSVLRDRLRNVPVHMTADEV